MNIAIGLHHLCNFLFSTSKTIPVIYVDDEGHGYAMAEAQIHLELASITQTHHHTQHGLSKAHKHT